MEGEVLQNCKTSLFLLKGNGKTDLLGLEEKENNPAGG